MVPDSRTPPDADRVRALNLPRPIVVGTVDADGAPAILFDRGRRRRVEQIQESWQIDEEWWREPISRRYYRLLLADGAPRTIFRDLIGDGWYEQAY